MKIKCIGLKTEQILAGIEPWETGEVEIDLATLTPEQRAVVAAGHRPSIMALDTESVITALRVRADKDAEEKKAATELQADHDAKCLAEIEAAGIEEYEETDCSTSVRVPFRAFRSTLTGANWGKWDCVRVKYNDTRDRLTAEANQRTAASRAAALAAAAPQIEAAKIAAQEKEEADKKEKAEALAVKQARRAEIGAVEMDIARGGRDWGTPWGAVVTASRGKDNYNFDAAEYDLSTETLTIRCRPGDVIAWGQKNFRKPKQTLHQRRKISADWLLKSL